MSAIAIDMHPIGGASLPVGAGAGGRGAAHGRVGSARPTGRGDHGALRVTRTGRLAVTLTVMLVAVLAAAITFAGSGGASSPPDRVITIGAGQTLSELAVTYLPQLSIQEAVAAIQSANQLQSDRIIAGQELVIPQP